MNKISMETKISKPFEDAMDLVVAALKEEGFGVLTEIDVRTTLKNKLDKDFRRYTILGACNPPLAYKALSSDPEIGLLLPCNVTIEASNNVETIIRFLDPKIMVALGDFDSNETLLEVSSEARERLVRVVNNLRQWE